MRWLVGLRTRNGTSRAVRVALCGRPVAVVRDGDWLPSWQHQTCKDRGCPACAQARSRRLAVQIREAVERRRELGSGELAFVTLTQPRRPGESASGAVKRFEATWQRMRKQGVRPVAGGLRVLEVTHSPQGWHVHAHCIVELFAYSKRVACPACRGAAMLPRRIAGQWTTRACRSCGSATQTSDGTMSEDLAELVQTWARLADGSVAAQCAVKLDDANAGQLAKYLSKLWELDDASATELFVAFAGKRLVQTWGSWYGSVRLGPQRAKGRQWFRGMFVADVERMHPRSYIEFFAPVSVRFEPQSHAWVEATRGARFRMRDACPLEPPQPHVVMPSPRRRGVRRRGARAPRELALLKCRGASVWRPVLCVFSMTAGAFLRMLRGDDRRADEHPPPSDNTPTPGADAARRACSARDGAWSHRYRTGRWLLQQPKPAC